MNTTASNHVLHANKPEADHDSFGIPKPLPVDLGKRSVEIPSIPGLSLTLFSKGYVCLKVKSRDFHGRRVTVGKPLYREQIRELVEHLFTIGNEAKTYEEANGTVPF